jgi:methionyl-tRNA formyltransferase
MRIVFIGAVQFSRHCLQEVLTNSGRVVAVFTLPRERAKFNADYADLSPVAAQYNVPVYLTKNINDPDNIEALRSLRPDVIFVFGWSQLISKPILDIPRLGCIGTHPALLPKNRGRHPLIWTLVEGLSESGLTFFYIDEGADSGDILWQRSFEIALEDDASTLYEKIKVLASQALREFLPQLHQGTIPRIPQDHSQATYWRKRTEKDGEIQWDAPTMTIYNLIRALTHPYVGAHTYLAGEKTLIWKAKLPSDPTSPDALALQPGIVFAQINQGFRVRTGDGHLIILDYGAAGDKVMTVGTKLGMSV